VIVVSEPDFVSGSFLDVEADSDFRLAFFSVHHSGLTKSLRALYSCCDAFLDSVA